VDRERATRGIAEDVAGSGQSTVNSKRERIMLFVVTCWSSGGGEY
jgi:hypothetical protein